MKKLLSLLLCLALLGGLFTVCAFAEGEGTGEETTIAAESDAEQPAEEPGPADEAPPAPAESPASAENPAPAESPASAAPQSANTDEIVADYKTKYDDALQAALNGLLFVTDGAKAYTGSYNKETFLNAVKEKLETLPEAAAFSAYIAKTADLETLYNTDNGDSLKKELDQLISAFSAAAKDKAFGFAEETAKTQCSARYNRNIIKYAKVYEARKAVVIANTKDPWEYGPSYTKAGAAKLIEAANAFIGNDKVKGYLAKGWFYTARTAYVNAIIAVNASLYQLKVVKPCIWERNNTWYFVFRYFFFGFLWMKF
ncbi:MAG: hypothetical protein LBG83_09650 [Oscillospiraceae bacterium]|jgi:hypothetical protein|nr:hypothetical protein [Oscillospiraceae bacterium]